jgi:hypothetical protein
MKRFSLFISIILIFAFILGGCTKKATKQQLIDQRTKLMEWYKSDDFKKLLLSHLNDDGTVKDQAAFEKGVKEAEKTKIDEIIKAMGFKSQEEFVAEESLLKDPDVEKSQKDLLETATKVTQNIIIERAAEFAKKSTENVQ